MPGLSLYNSCLRRVSLFLRDGIWNSRRENPICILPSEVVSDLVSTTLLLQELNGFRAADLELLLTSGRLREFKIHSMNVKQELGRVLRSLTLACQNLEVLTLMKLSCRQTPDTVEALEELLRNSPNLKHIHCGVEFDLKVLRNCKKLRSIMLNFYPKQPWYDFLEEEHRFLQPLDSLEIFTLCKSNYYESPSLICDYIVALLRHCPALVSLGWIESSWALAQLHRTGILPRVKLRICTWNDLARTKKVNPLDCEERIRDAVIYHPFVQELHFCVYSIQSVAYLSSLRNLSFLDISTAISDHYLSVVFCNVLKDIGHQLKHLFFLFSCSMDISTLLQKCPKLEALGFGVDKYTEFAIPTVSLPNLKHLTIYDGEGYYEQRVLPLFSDCHNLEALFIRYGEGLDDKALHKFLRRNSLLNLKLAYFECCNLTSRGFRKFFLNAPYLEFIEIRGGTSDEKHEVQSCVREALLETNHKAVFNEYVVTMDDEFFNKKRQHCFLKYAD